VKILLSAYACEPNRGSEPGVGWNWALEIAQRGHEVIVITRSNNKKLIDNANYDRERITFLYHDFPGYLIKLKKIIGVNLYYVLWQITLLSKIRKFKKMDIDVIHHITFGVFRNISYLPFFMNKPFIFGPVGGGEFSPKNLTKVFSVKYRIFEFIRLTLNLVTYYSPIYRLFLKKTVLIVCKTPQTLEYIPPKYRIKTMLSLEIGVKQMAEVQAFPNVRNRDMKTLLYVGRFLYLKGIELILETYKIVVEKDPELKLIFIGEGPEIHFIRDFSEKFGLKNLVIVEWLDKQKLDQYYAMSSLLLFPSLHDSSGNVVLEALSFGLPVVSLDVGGPKEVIGQGIDTIVPHNNKATKELAVDIAEKIKALLANKELYEVTCEKSFIRSQELTWKKSVERVYIKIESKIH